MRYWQFSFILVFALALVGCSTIPFPAFGEPTAIPLTETATPSPAPSATDMPLPTLTPTVTLTPSPTIFKTPTKTPVNFALAETGFDIADVRYSYPREDMLVIDFKYRLDERLEGYGGLITVELPQRCKDNTYGFSFDVPEEKSREFGLFFLTRQLTGEGRITFKMTLEGRCETDGVEFSILPLDYPTWPLPDDLFYKEYVPQSFEVARNFPTVNSGAIALRNFRFEPGDDWSGTFLFDYEISEAIPIPPEEYHFEIEDGGGNSDCYLAAVGPQIMSHSGTYSVEIDLAPDDRPEGQYCRLPDTNIMFSNTRVSLHDDLAVSMVYYRDPDFSYTFWKDW